MEASRWGVEKIVPVHILLKDLKNSGKERFLGKIQDLTFGESSINQGM